MNKIFVTILMLFITINTCYSQDVEKPKTPYDEIIKSLEFNGASKLNCADEFVKMYIEVLDKREMYLFAKKKEEKDSKKIELLEKENIELKLIINKITTLDNLVKRLEERIGALNGRLNRGN